ncbi:MAG: VWA domain-containing protein, partial [Polyangiaceae bacterium]|nr:VWA domain-containing protein [Polyangiaceae bacterium]
MTTPVLLPLSPHDASLEPEGPVRAAGLSCRRGPLPLRGVDVHAKIVGLLAEVLVTQTFVNDFDGPIEATYTFPLPDRAALTECRVSLGGRRLRGVLRERGEARQGYEAALREGKAAALAEEERPDVFTTTLGNLGPGEQAEVRLVLVVPLDARDGEATFRFPLVVAPRFVPGSPLPGPAVGAGVEADTDRVGDASRLSPPRLVPGAPGAVQVSLTIDLEAPEHALGELRSSLHELELTAPPWGYRLTLPPGGRLDRDVVLRFRERRQGAPARLLVRRDREGEGATFALTIDPVPAGGPAPPRDVVFVLDRSGSMEGWKMTTARRAVMAMIDALGERDRFALLAFDDTVESPHLGPNGLALAPATFRQRSAALAFLERLGARGGTEMGPPLLDGARLLQADASRSRAIVLVTDGQVSQEDEILGPLGRAVGRVPVAAVGIDSAVNAGFLQRLAALTGGFCELVESEARLEAVLEGLHARLATPVLTDLELAFEGARVDPEATTPRRLGAVFPGVPWRVYGRFLRCSEAASVAVRARDASGAAFRAEAPATPTESGALLPIWARARLRDLEDRYLVDAHLRDELERAIVQTSLEAGVLSRFTAFLVIDEESRHPAGAPLRSVAQPVEMPAGSPPGAVNRRSRPDARQSATRAGVIRGGIADFSPEQARGVRTDARSDVHALGRSLYQLVSGTHPFRRANTLDTLYELATKEAPPLPGVDAALAALVARALATDPLARFADALAFDAALAVLAAEAGPAPTPSEFEALLETIVPGARQRSDDARRRASAAAPSAIKLGQGESADAWLTLRRDRDGHERAIVVRTLLPHLAEDPDFEACFLDEASLEHPHVVRVLEAGTTSGGLSYLASEYVGGLTLAALASGLRQRQQGLGASPIVFAIVRQIASALAFAHALRDASGQALDWHHGRLRAIDVLIGFDGVVKIKGFGPAPSPAFAPARSPTPLPFTL